MFNYSESLTNYTALMTRATANDDDEDASLLVSRADRLYEEAENLNLRISELERK